MAEEVDEKDFQDPRNKKSAGKNPLLTMLLVINIVLIGAVGYFQYVGYMKMVSEPTVRDIVKAEMKGAMETQEDQEMGVAKEEDGILFPLQGFAANLAQGDGPRRFIRLEIVLKFDKNSNEEEFKGRKPQIRDRIISILNTKRPEDVLKAQGKAYLKEEIKAAINTFLIDGSVIDVYYTGFQVN